jgi:dipeptidyl-peptidase-4
MNRLLVFLTLLLPLGLRAQSPNFEAAEHFDVPNLQKQVGTTQIIPFFLKKSNRFWYIANDSVTGESKGNYYLVDPDKKQKINLFDKLAIINDLQKLTKEEVNRTAVTYNPQFSKDEQTVQVSYKGDIYDYNYIKKTLIKQPKKEAQKYPRYHMGTLSPDKQWVLYSRHHNLYLKSITDSVEYALSSDGAEYHSFSINELDKFADENGPTDVVWSEDSKTFYVLRKDTRKTQNLSVINSLGNPRPYVNTYKYELPGDKDVTQYEFFVGNAIAHKLKKVNIDRWPDQEVEVLRNQNGGEEVFLLCKKRSREEMELCAVDLNTGELRVVIQEISKPFINQDLFNVSVMNRGKDILWWSDRSGWGQYYHYNNKGRLLNPVTTGSWTAGKIAAVDTLKRTIYFYGYGKESGRNPNYAFLYKVGLDESKPVLLTPENATHSVFMSPSREYFVDYYSRIDLEPTTIVRHTTGKLVQEIFKPDLSKLYAYGWKQPEMFTVKAKDGVTDLYGLMWKPFNFDPNKKYPIISQVYPGPFTETVWNEFTIFDRYNNTSLAQTGFIVVVMGHRGGSPYRNAAYYKFGYANLRDYALEDDKYGLEQLAERFKFIDLSRVGIIGHSGGGAMATTALCTYPDFYKVAVSSSGNHDNNIYNRTWGETYNGLGRKIDLNQSLARNLKGHLLLVTGESDQNVNPASTYRMVDALIKADKQFDLLVLPGQSHTYEEPYKTYFQKQTRRFFSKYLE